MQRVARILGCGLLFAIFGTGGMLLAGVVIPIATRLQRSHEPADLTAQRWIQRSFAFYIRFGTALGIWGVVDDGLERLSEGASLVVANHPTLLDIVFLLSFMPQGDCVVKREAWTNPALRGIVRVAGYIPNDDGDALVESCVRRLRSGRSVVLFPEGSRSPEHGLRPFRRGAAHIALRSGCRIVPVSIECAPPFLKKGQPWYSIPNAKLRYSFSVGKPVRVKDLIEGDVDRPRAARHVTRLLQSHFESRLSDGST